MIYDSLPVLCRKCLEEEVPEKELLKYLDEYVRALPAHLRVSDKVYTMRLKKCAACPNRIQYTCTLCGCYIQTRAAKSKMCCPIAGAPEWTQADPDEGE